MSARGKENGKYQGAKWITRERRLAIYLRDGLACSWCGEALEDDAILTLDHLTPYSSAGKPDNTSANLVTSCRRCNSSRADRSIKDFAVAVAAYLNHGISAQEIIAHVRETATRPVDVKNAKMIIARRGGFSLTLAAMRG